jgi:hypothetical protein
MSAAHKECSGCGLPLEDHEIQLDSTGSLYTSEGELLTIGEVLCEYCFDNAYPIGSTAFDELSDADIMENY